VFHGAGDDGIPARPLKAPRLRLDLRPGEALAHPGEAALLRERERPGELRGIILLERGVDAQWRVDGIGDRRGRLDILPARDEALPRGELQEDERSQSQEQQSEAGK